LAVALSVVLTGALTVSSEGALQRASGTVLSDAPPVESAAVVPEPPDWGVFQVRCHWSHSASADPIVAPGVPGGAHRHEFFGNVSTNAHTTTRRLTRRGTTCTRPGDKSAYWAPTLYRDGKRVQPNHTIVYYRSGFLRDASVIRPAPRGLRIIAGDGDARGPQSRKITQWSCEGDGPRGSKEVPASCPGVPLRLRILFPNCWNGKTLDSANHKRHMAYSHRHDNVCPASHPVTLPTLQLGFRYDIRGPLKRITLSSGDRYTGHADFWNAWDPAALRRLVQTCVLGGRTCDSPPLPPPGR
jgi:hypothetical protein